MNATTCESIKHLCDPLPGAPKRYPAGRVCAHPGCGTVLSTYNKAAKCYTHDGAITVTAAELELSGFGTKTCVDCGVPKPANGDYFNVDNSRVDGLRSVCSECKRARDRARNQAKRGPDSGLTDAAPVRDHIRALVAAGMSYADIARASGTSHDVVANVLYRTVKRVRLARARAILGVEVAP